MHARCRDVLHECNLQQHHGLLDSLLPAIGRVMGLGDDFLLGQLGGRATTFARINYYLPCARPDLVVGVASHGDASIISVVMVDDTVGGLQVLKDGVWYEVPPSTDPHGLLILVGDFAEVYISFSSYLLFLFSFIYDLNLFCLILCNNKKHRY